MYSTGNVGSLPLLCEPLYQQRELFSAPKYWYIVIRLKSDAKNSNRRGK